jgi:hypothetical protein
MKMTTKNHALISDGLSSTYISQFLIRAENTSELNITLPISFPNHLNLK